MELEGSADKGLMINPDWRGGLVRTNDYNFARELMKVVSKSNKRIKNVVLREVREKPEDEKTMVYSVYYELSWD